MITPAKAHDILMSQPWGRRKGPVKTRRGPRYLKAARPDGRYWSAWQEDPGALRKAAYAEGISMHKKNTYSNSYEIVRWIPLAQKLSMPTSEEKIENFNASWGTESTFEVPMPLPLTARPFQCHGVELMLKHKRLMMADDVGIGKTCQSIGVSNIDQSIERVLCIVPAALKQNWSNEWDKFSTREHTTHILKGRRGDIPEPAGGLTVYIINYQILAGRSQWLRSIDFDMIIMDESGKFMGNLDAQCTQALCGWSRKKQGAKAIFGSRSGDPLEARYMFCLSATPFSIRHKQIWPTLRLLRPDIYTSKRAFYEKFCGTWDTGFDASVNGKQLGIDLRSDGMLIRRFKSQVLEELQPLRYKITEVPPSTALKHEADIISGDYALKMESLLELKDRMDTAEVMGDKKALSEMKTALRRSWQDLVGDENFMRARRVFAEGKVTVATEYARLWLNEHPDEKLIILGCHVGLLREGLAKTLEDFGVCLLDGSIAANKKQDPVDEFQGNPDKRVFVGSKSAYEGITLTAAAHLMWMEIPLSPADIVQGSGRHHRISQARDCVVEYVVVQESIDARLLAMMSDKIQAQQSVLDWRSMEAEGYTQEAPPSRNRWEAEGAKVPWATRRRMLKALAELMRPSGIRDGLGLSSLHMTPARMIRAAGIEGMTDNYAGWLSKICIRYRKQVNPQLVEELRELQQIHDQTTSPTGAGT